MNRSTFIALACLIGSALYGQQVTWLPDQPAFKKNTEFYIAQWDEEDVLINDFKSLHVLDKQTLKVKNSFNRKGFSDEKGGRYIGMMKTENGWVAMGSSCRLMQKKDSDCSIQYAPMEKDGFATPKDWVTFPRKGAGAASATLTGSNVEISNNGKYILRWTDGKFIVYDASFTELYSKETPDIFTINGQHVFMRTSHRVIGDEGNIYMSGVMMNEKKKNGDPEKYHPFFLKYDRANDQFFQHTIDVKNGMVLYPKGKKNYVLAKTNTSLEGRDDAQVLFDEKNGRITVAGIYGDSNGGGVFSVQYDFRNDQVVPLQRHPFPTDLSKKISDSSFKGKEVKGTVILQDVLTKENGDIMLLLELDRSKVEPQMHPNIPTTADFDCLDILFFDIGKDNELKFYGNIPKKQEAAKMMEEVSFVAAISGNDVHVVFNTLKKKADHELISVKIDEQGVIEQKSLMELGKNTTILPNKLSWSIAFDFEGVVDRVQGFRKPVQISGNEVIVRAIKDKDNSLLKITF